MSGGVLEEQKPPDDDALQRLIDQLYEFLTTPDPQQCAEGSELVIRLEPNDFGDDPRILELLELLRAAGLEVNNSAELSEVPPDFGVGVLHDGHQQQGVTDAVKAEFGPQLDEQSTQTKVERAQGEPRSKPVEEQIELREAFKDAVRGLNVLVNELAHHCAERIRSGCGWWEEDVPKPIRQVLEAAAAGAAGAAAIQAPVTASVIAVCFVALVSRRR